MRFKADKIVANVANWRTWRWRTLTLLSRYLNFSQVIKWGIFGKSSSRRIEWCIFCSYATSDCGKKRVYCAVGFEPICWEMLAGLLVCNRVAGRCLLVFWFTTELLGETCWFATDLLGDAWCLACLELNSEEMSFGQLVLSWVAEVCLQSSGWQLFTGLAGFATELLRDICWID